MRKIYCIKCKKYKEFKKTERSYICYKILLFSSICKCGSEGKRIFMEGESIEIIKILGLINNIGKYQKIYNNA